MRPELTHLYWCQSQLLQLPKKKPIVGSSYQLVLPNLPDRRYFRKKLHSASPGLPNALVNVTGTKIQVLLGTKIEIIHQHLAIVVVNSPYPNFVNLIQALTQLVVTLVESLKEFRKESGLLEMLRIKKCCEPACTSQCRDYPFDLKFLAREL
jgi:hypothetical protein